MKVLAAVVTHNRRALLSRCIDALESQTRMPDGLLVIDNGSTDGTAEMLAGRGVHAIRQANVGSAGGWHRALEEGLGRGFDAVWLMDDDGFPALDALERLLPHMGNGTACASSVVVCEDDRDRLVFPMPVLDDAGLPVLFGVRRKMARLSELLDATYPYAHLFNGALVAAAAVRACGNVEREFFVFGEELDFLYRLRRFGNVVSVRDALQFHPDVGRRPYTDAKVYYYVRNTLIINARYLNHPYARHVAAVVAVLARTANRNGLRAALSYVVGPSSKSLRQAVVRGMRGQLGRDHER